MKVVEDSSLPHVQLMIGLLLYFDQVGQIKYVPAARQIRFVFFAKEIADVEFAKLRSLIQTHLQAHNRLAAVKSAVGIELIRSGPVDQIVVQRELDPFLRKDLTIVIELINQVLPTGSIIENEILDLPQLIYPEELDALVADALADDTKQELTAFWHQGRLTVYPAMQSEQS